MFKIIGLLLLVLCLDACQPSQETVVTHDLTKAASLNMQLGLAYLEQGDRPRAKKKLLRAVSQAPNSAEVNAALAYFFEQTAELGYAKAYYLKALSLSSNEGAQLNNYGAFLCRQGDYKQAEIYFLKAAADKNYLHTAGAYENAGLCALLVPDRLKARQYFIKAINQDPARHQSLYQLAKIEIRRGEDVKALALLQRYPKLVFGDRHLLYLAKQLALHLGKRSTAQEYDIHLQHLIAPIGHIGA